MGNKEIYEQFESLRKTFRDKAERLSKEGKTLDEIISATEVEYDNLSDFIMENEKELQKIQDEKIARLREENKDNPVLSSLFALIFDSPFIPKKDQL